MMSNLDDQDGPVGVGGWMYLFLFGFAFASPILLLWGTYSNLYSDPTVQLFFGDDWSTYQTFEWVMVVLALAAIAFIVWRLFNVQNPTTVKLTLVAIPALSLGLLVFDVYVTAMFAGLDPAFLFSQIGPDFIRSAIYCVIWCSYFLVSKRVKNTYYERPIDDVDEVFT
jgi:hypothetical protein